MKIKRKLQRLRYYCSWKYPTLYHYAGRLVFPAQFGALCLVLVSAVNYYQDNYSFKATERMHRTSQQVATTQSAPTPKLSLENSSTIKVSNAKPKPFLASVATPTKQIITSQSALAAEVERAEVILETKQQQTEQLELKIQKAKLLLKRSQAIKSVQSMNTEQSKDGSKDKHREEKLVITSTTTATPSTAPKLYGHKWIEALRPELFVIQIASSTDYERLKDDAHSKAKLADNRSTEIQNPLAIYPFKKTPNGKIVYGLSTGLYKTHLAAMKDAATVSNENDFWVRNVADVKTQIAAVR